MILTKNLIGREAKVVAREIQGDCWASSEIPALFCSRAVTIKIADDALLVLLHDPAIRAFKRVESNVGEDE